MKIMIIGFSGSGKSTLAKTLGDLYKIPVLHFDSVFFKPNWVEKSYEEVNSEMKNFLDNNDSWVIDGNYTKHYFERRADEADMIIYMNFNRFTCFKNVYKRYREYKGKVRYSSAPGCEEKLDLTFIYWVLFKSRTSQRKKKYAFLKEKYPDKFVEIKNRKEENNWINNITI